MGLGTSMPSLTEALTPPYLASLGPLMASIQAYMVLSFLLVPHEASGFRPTASRHSGFQIAATTNYLHLNHRLECRRESAPVVNSKIGYPSTENRDGVLSIR